MADINQDEISFFWDGTSTGDAQLAPYTASMMAFIFRLLFLSGDNQGVIYGYANQLAITNPSGTDIQVATGAALVHGWFYWSDAVETRTLTTPSIATRTDLLVLRLDEEAQEVWIIVKTGNEGGGAPPLQQDDIYWEIPLAQIRITTAGTITITDNREFAQTNLNVEVDIEGWSVIDTKITGATDSEIIFEDISPQFTYLLLMGTVKHTDNSGVGGGGDTEMSFLSLQINADKTGKYSFSNEYVIDTTVAAVSVITEGSGNLTRLPLPNPCSTDAPAAAFSPIYAFFYNSNDTDFYKMVQAIGGALPGAGAEPSIASRISGMFNSFSPITALRIFNTNDETGYFAANCELTLYGYKE